MRFVMVNYICGPNGHAFKAPEIAGNSYGEFYLRSAGTSEARYLNALRDSTFHEVEALLLAQPEVANMTALKRAKVLQQVYGMAACDRDASGYPFQIGLHPKCPICGTQEMKSWESSSPAEPVDLDIAPVTHQAWAAYSEQGKLAQLRNCLAQALTAT